MPSSVVPRKHVLFSDVLIPSISAKLFIAFDLLKKFFEHGLVDASFDGRDGDFRFQPYLDICIVADGVNMPAPFLEAVSETDDEALVSENERHEGNPFCNPEKYKPDVGLFQVKEQKKARKNGARSDADAGEVN